MNSVYLVCLIAFGIHVVAVPAFIWAARRRQLGLRDQEAFHTIEADAPTVTSPAGPGRMSLAALEAAQTRPYTRRGMIAFFTVMIAMGAAILWAVSATVIAASSAPAANIGP